MGKGKGRYQAFIEAEDGSALRVSLPAHRPDMFGKVPRVERRLRAFGIARRERDEHRAEAREVRAAYGLDVR